MKKQLKKIIPDRRKLEKSSALRPIAHLLVNPRIWHINRRTIPIGIAIGLFFGSLPIIGQMPLAAFVAIAMRGNMPIAVLSTWISNPISMPFLFTANYYFGARILGSKTVCLDDIDWSLDAMLSLGGNILVPLYFGSVVVGVILSSLAYLGLHAVWRLNIVSHHRERKARRQKKNLDHQK